MNTILPNFDSIDNEELYDINGGSTKAVATGAAIVGGLLGLGSAVAYAFGADKVGAGLASASGVAFTVSGVCYAIPAP